MFQSQMNVDIMSINQGLKMTTYHMDMALEMRCYLKNVVVFSKLDVGYGFQSNFSPPRTAKIVVFKSHEGVHKKKSR